MIGIKESKEGKIVIEVLKNTILAFEEALDYLDDDNDSHRLHSDILKNAQSRSSNPVISALGYGEDMEDEIGPNAFRYVGIGTIYKKLKNELERSLNNDYKVIGETIDIYTERGTRAELFENLINGFEDALIFLEKAYELWEDKMDEAVYDAIAVSNYIDILYKYIREIKRAGKLSKTFVFEPGLFLYNDQDDSRFPNTPTRIAYEAYHDIPYDYVMIDKMFGMLNKKTSIIHKRLHIYHDENGNRLVPIDLELQYLQEEITDGLFLYLEFLEDVKDQFQKMEDENE